MLFGIGEITESEGMTLNLTKEVLDELTQGGCAVEECAHDHTMLFFTSRCHPGQGLYVSYDRNKVVLDLTCKVCEEQVISFGVLAKEG